MSDLIRTSLFFSRRTRPTYPRRSDQYGCLIERLRSLQLSTGKFVVIKQLGHYFPNSQIQNAAKSDFSAESLAAINSEFATTPKINEANIHKIFQTLLEIEDLVTLLPYPALSQEHAVINFDREMRCYFFYLKNPYLKDRITPKSDEVVIRLDEYLPFDKKSIDILNVASNIIGVVHQIKNQRVYFELDENDPKFHFQVIHNRRFAIIIRPNRLPIRYQYEALDELSESPYIREYLFPNHIDKLKAMPECSLSLINTDICTNPEQLQAVQILVDGVLSLHTPYIIFGPPGTGKTTTITEAILQLQCKSAHNRILVTAGSNSACDTIALRLCQHFERHECENALIRLYSKSVLKNRPPMEPLLQQFSNYEHSSLPPVEELRSFDIIVATLCQVGKLVSGNIGEGAHFTHVFIDEAGASTEPETLVAIMGIKSINCRIILSGDHKQLGPVLMSRHASRLGLQQSLMQRLMERDCYAVDESGNYNRACQLRLRRNYRSHPQIVHLYNHLYYNNELLAENKADAFKYAFPDIQVNLKEFPIIFQNVSGTCNKNKRTRSSYNEEEVVMVIHYLENILNGELNGDEVTQKDIGIISPYKQQCKHIREALKQKKWLEIEVGSVEIFQGREKEIIVASFVRSNSDLGFVNEPCRLNVTLSRAKSLLILIGNTHTLGSNEDFKFVIDECAEHKTLRHDQDIQK